MNIVILHCHYERGGVTQVVENHVHWLRDCDRVEQIVLVSGDRAGGLSDATTAGATMVVISDFDYDLANQSYGADLLSSRSSRIVQELQSRLAAIGITEDNSVLHWHNHSLGKNTAAPAAIEKLAESGWRQLLQIHDFAEDNRPENYRRLIQASGARRKADLDRYLYPVASQIHFATLTRADASVLTGLGVPEMRTHCLPNSVVPPTAAPPDKDYSRARVRRALRLPADTRWCIYPVRGIRRKNVGEFLMLSRWLAAGQFAGLTLSPTTPVEQRSYARWKQVAVDVAPRAVFDAGEHPDITLAENMSASDFIVTTSVAEGFGMAYLEPWLMQRGVIARRLPTVTDDFEQSGVVLSHLYDTMPIPGDRDWIGDCRAECEDAMQSAWSSLPREFRPSLDIDGGDDPQCIDFARLTPARQIEVLRKVAGDTGFESEAMQRSSRLIASLTDPPDEDLIRRNAEVVRETYSPQNAGKELLAIYEALLAAQCDREIESPRNAGIGVDLIANARPFFPCRTE